MPQVDGARDSAEDFRAPRFAGWIPRTVLLISLACKGSPLRAGDTPPWIAGLSKGAHAQVGDGKASLGVNVSGVEYWGQEWTFLDLVKRGKDWGEPPGANYRVDKDGWINWMAPDTKRVATIGDGDPSFHRNFPLGRYVALYEGKGQVSVQCGHCREISRVPGRFVVDVLGGGSVQIVIEAIDPANHIRNLRVVPIEHEATHLTQPFHPKFLERLRPFAAIRNFGNQKTNGNLQTKWSDRTKVTDAFQGGDAGVALEYMVQLANTLGQDPWFCIPPRADDDYVRSFARTLFTLLGPERKVYVEYGNEIWNESAPYSIDGAWMTARARALRIPLASGDDESDMTFRLRYQVVRSRQIFEMFGQEMKAKKIDARRLVRVISSQASFFDRIRFTLDYKFPDGTLAYQHADALGVAPYFAGLWTPKESQLAEETWTVDDIVTYADCSVSSPEQAPAACARIPHDPVVKVIRGDWELAHARGLRLLGYEGGQHMVAWNGHPAFIEKLAVVNRAPRMKDVYIKYLNAWRDNGGELMFLLGYVHDPGKHGYWGMLERQDQAVAQAPKFDACLQFIAKQPSWWKDPWPPATPTSKGPKPSPDARPDARSVQPAPPAPARK